MIRQVYEVALKRSRECSLFQVCTKPSKVTLAPTHWWRGGYMPASDISRKSSHLLVTIKQPHAGVLLSHSRGEIIESRVVRSVAWGQLRVWQPVQDAACKLWNLPCPCPLLPPPPLPLVHAIYLPGLRHSVIHKNVVSLSYKSPAFEWASCQPGWQNDN